MVYVWLFDSQNPLRVAKTHVYEPLFDEQMLSNPTSDFVLDVSLVVAILWLCILYVMPKRLYVNLLSY
jgi:hypothetical protein